MTEALCNAVEVERYVDAVYDPDDTVEIRLIPPDSARGLRVQSVFCLARTLADAWMRKDLKERNSKGYGIYVGVNPRRGAGSAGVSARNCKAAMPCGCCDQCVQLARVLFVDFDDVAIDVVRQRIEDANLPWPTMIVSSGRQDSTGQAFGFHVYWRLECPLEDLGQWKRYELGLIHALDSDRSVHNPSRILRLPGFDNTKHSGHPACTVIEVNSDRVYPASEFPQTTGSPAPVATADTVPAGELGRATEYFMTHKIAPGTLGRNPQLFQAACDFSAHGRSIEQALAALIPCAVRDGLEEHGARCTIESAYSKPREPGHVEQTTTVPPSTPASNGETKRVVPIPASELGSDLAVDWVWYGYAARGHVTLFTGLWKAGKSTLIGHLLVQMAQGGSLVGDVHAGKVIIVTEEGRTLWARRRDDYGFGDHCHFVLQHFLAKPSQVEWDCFVADIAGLVRERGYSLVIFDTFGAVSPVTNENDAAETTASLMCLRRITDAGAAVLLVHHPRKGDASEGQASRGSGALPGFVDIIVELRRLDAKARTDRRRTLTSYSRFDETPPDAVIQLAENGCSYEYVGSRRDVSQTMRFAAIMDVLPPQSPGLDVQDVRSRWGKEIDHMDPPGERTLREDLRTGYVAGKWKREGKGKAGDSYRYYVGSSPSSGNSACASAPVDRAAE